MTPDIIRFDMTDSTNLRLKELARAGSPIGTVVIASRQTGGRGRLGRSFWSPEGGLYMSVLLRGDYPDTDPMLLTSLTAVAVRQAIEDLSGLSCDIKWVNDILYHGKKLCGMLAEGIVGEKGLASVVMGIGIDLKNTPAPDDISSLTTSVEAASGVLVTPEDMLTRVLYHIDRLTRLLPDRGFIADYRRYSCLMGKEVRVIRSGEELYRARVTGIADDASLMLDRAGGSVLLRTGEVSVRLTE